MGEFEDRLLSDLMRSHGAALAQAARPAPRRSMPRPVWIAGSAAAVAGAAIAGMSAFGGVPPAYAVTRNADGTVTVSVRDVRAVDPANAELQRLAAPVRVVPMTADCTDTFVVDTAPAPNGGPRWSFTADGDDGSITVSTSGVNPGSTLLLSARMEPDGNVTMGFSAPVAGRAPSCLRAPNVPAQVPATIPPSR
jgi:hypothetical protein